MTSFTCYWFCLECTLNDLHTVHSFTSFKSQPRGPLGLTFPNFLPTVDPSSLTGYPLSHDLILFSSQPVSLSETILFFLMFCFIYLLVVWVLTDVHGLSLVAVSGATLSCGAWAFPFDGLLCCAAQALGA